MGKMDELGQIAEKLNIERNILLAKLVKDPGIRHTMEWWRDNTSKRK